MTDLLKEATPSEVLEAYRGDANAIRLQMPPRSWSGTAIMHLWDALDGALREHAWMKALILRMERHHVLRYVEGPSYATGDFDELAFVRRLVEGG